jgi:hypothetical protein
MAARSAPPPAASAVTVRTADGHIRLDESELPDRLALVLQLADGGVDPAA